MKDVTIGEAGIEHLSNFVVIPNKSEVNNKAAWGFASIFE